MTSDKHKFTIGGSRVAGFRVDENGEVFDFEGTLRNFYNDLSRASMAARRKYGDQTITVVSCIADKQRYEVDVDELLKIATPVD